MASKSQYPEIWTDDEQMNVMFSHFRQSRDLNPRSWDSKMQFWTQMILDECAKCGDVLVDTSSFASRFSRSGRTPKCLGRIFHEMRKNNEIIPLEEFNKEANLSIMSWAFDRLVVNPVRWGWQSFLAGESPEEINEGRYVVWSVIKSVAAGVEQLHQSRVKNPNIDHVVEMSTLLKQCESVVKDQETLALVLLWLRKNGRVMIIYGQQTTSDKTPQIRAVKFAPKDLPSVQAVNDFDRNVLKLKLTESELESELDKNYTEMEKALSEAKRYVHEGQKTNARAALRIKKKCEEQIQKRSQALANVQDILSKIRESHADRMIVAAYEAGAEALKASNKAAPQTSAVDNIMVELEQLFADEEELKASFTMGAMGDADISMSELEAELAEISAEETRKEEKEEKEKVPTLPSVPTFDPSRQVEPLDCDLSDDDDEILANIPEPSYPTVPETDPASVNERVLAET